MKKGQVRLLEPVMKVEVTTPEEHMGDVIGDLNSRRGLVGEFVDRPGNLRLIKSFVPLSEMYAPALLILDFEVQAVLQACSRFKFNLLHGDGRNLSCLCIPQGRYRLHPLVCEEQY